MPTLDDPPEILGGRCIEAIKERVAGLAKQGKQILLVGETGTGKELLAQYAAYAVRPGKSFLTVNFPEHTDPAEFRSQFFGHRKGSFTGAHDDSMGSFRKHEGGVVFLDELGKADRKAHAWLLRFLQPTNGQMREITPLGQDPTQVDLFVVAACKPNEEMGDDLRYRFDVVEVPRLADRVVGNWGAGGTWSWDFDLFHIIAKACKDRGFDYVSTIRLHQALRNRWPGNYRQFQREVIEGEWTLPLGVTAEGFARVRRDFRATRPDETDAQLHAKLFVALDSLGSFADQAFGPYADWYDFLRWNRSGDPVPEFFNPMHWREDYEADPVGFFKARLPKLLAELLRDQRASVPYYLPLPPPPPPPLVAPPPVLRHPESAATKQEDAKGPRIAVKLSTWNLKDARRDAERDFLQRAMEEIPGTHKDKAAALGLGPSAFSVLLKKHGLR